MTTFKITCKQGYLTVCSPKAYEAQTISTVSPAPGTDPPQGRGSCPTDESILNANPAVIISITSCARVMLPTIKTRLLRMLYTPRPPYKHTTLPSHLGLWQDLAQKNFCLVPTKRICNSVASKATTTVKSESCCYLLAIPGPF